MALVVTNNDSDDVDTENHADLAEITDADVYEQITNNVMAYPEQEPLAEEPVVPHSNESHVSLLTPPIWCNSGDSQPLLQLTIVSFTQGGARLHIRLQIVSKDMCLSLHLSMRMLTGSRAATTVSTCSTLYKPFPVTGILPTTLSMSFLLILQQLSSKAQNILHWQCIQLWQLWCQSEMPTRCLSAKLSWMTCHLEPQFAGSWFLQCGTVICQLWQ